jgi:hypothetical protein
LSGEEAVMGTTLDPHDPIVAGRAPYIMIGGSLAVTAVVALIGLALV